MDGCRFGFYGELQEQILKDLGYDFQFINLMNSTNVFSLYKTIKKLGSEILFVKFLYYLILLMQMLKMIDNFEFYIRENVGFEVIPNSFENLKQEFFSKLKKIKTIKELYKTYNIYDKKLKNVKIDKPEDALRIGIVGELYTLMEPYSNYYMEKELAKNKIVVSRYITVSYLLFKKRFTDMHILKKAGKYLKYLIGADGVESVSKSKELAKLGYDRNNSYKVFPDVLLK